MPETAIIIRCRNEERWIGETLKRLTDQTYQDFEIIVVDSGSTDRTLEITRTFDVTLIEIAPEAFTYPSAINLGIKASTATDYYVMLSAHSLPLTNAWLADGITHFTDPKVLGVHGPLKALPDGTIWDKLFYGLGYFKTRLKAWPQRYYKVTKPGLGALGFTNAIIRKDLWQQYPINEAFAGGGEDGDWLEHWLTKGYYAITETKFAVHHSHYLTLRGWYAQLAEWKTLTKPKAFHYLSFRKDGAHTTSD